MDRLDPKRRSANMAAIKGRDTTPEMAVRRLLHRMGYRFRLHRRDLPGNPDVVLAKHKAAILVHGCFWHQHDAARRKARKPKSNQGYWLPKLKRNGERDARNTEALSEAGWRVLKVWECETRDSAGLERKLARFLE
jgi:DNA mismatch endonuclease, patch repair protein